MSRKRNYISGPHISIIDLDSLDILSHLPLDLSCQILKYMELEEIKKCLMVCKRWRFLVDSEKQWRSRFSSYNWQHDAIVKEMMARKIPWKEIFLKRFKAITGWGNMSFVNFERGRDYSAIHFFGEDLFLEDEGEVIEKSAIFVPRTSGSVPFLSYLSCDPKGKKLVLRSPIYFNELPIKSVSYKDASSDVTFPPVHSFFDRELKRLINVSKDSIKVWNWKDCSFRSPTHTLCISYNLQTPFEGLSKFEISCSGDYVYIRNRLTDIEQYSLVDGSRKTFTTTQEVTNILCNERYLIANHELSVKIWDLSTSIDSEITLRTEVLSIVPNVSHVYSDLVVILNTHGRIIMMDMINRRST
eukprot:TRINITY_DN525_c2_g1_i1.p1 TRINITY_DN525_c2_g1~~TRINITY_DN525_c2_g1_i1.p1  ORF type:complete len:357 (+),score=25.99 TRINITY_DN525_c2_g1_i1:29-1099(+)